MDTLPHEVIEHIISFLVPNLVEPLREPYEKASKPSPNIRLLTPVATTSSRLAAAVERWTFRHIRINSDELSEFAKLFTPSRRASLTNLTYTIILPSYDEDAAIRAESPEERAANDEAYTRAIHALFNLLSDWEKEDPNLPRRLSLDINHPESPSDRPWPSKYAPWNANSVTDWSTIHEGRYLHSYISLNRPETLPVLQRVTRLNMLRPEERYAYRNTRPTVPVFLAMKLPSIEEFNFSVDDDEKRFPQIRRQNREDIANLLQGLSLPSLKRIDFDFTLRRFRDEAATPPALHEQGATDLLSSTIHNFALSHNLMDLTLTGVFDITLIRPLGSMSTTRWPNLQFFDIHLHINTPAGGWYFVAPSAQAPAYAPPMAPMAPMAYAPPIPMAVNNIIQAIPPAAAEDAQFDHSNLHDEIFSFIQEARYSHLTPVRVFRGTINTTTMVPFVNAYADALTQMPSLKSSMLGCQIEDDTYDGEPGWFTFAYFAPCGNAKKNPSTKVCPNCRRGTTRELVTWLLGWTPSEALMDKFRSLQADTHPEPLIEKDMATYLRDRGMGPEPHREETRPLHGPMALLPPADPDDITTLTTMDDLDPWVAGADDSDYDDEDHESHEHDEEEGEDEVDVNDEAQEWHEATAGHYIHAGDENEGDEAHEANHIGYDGDESEGDNDNENSDDGGSDGESEDGGVELLNFPLNGAL
ncbi:unnamed protein product [Clonostachys rosea]|uniref:F-box domain-containing protein n=1 Tax=Bionectria ochroleuca TaxID=29856 RepID=A0ABY6UKK4_BIOOC|nr:unnamed protein product [Clonostachys rosea]